MTFLVVPDVQFPFGESWQQGTGRLAVGSGNDMDMTSIPAIYKRACE
jgi:hypothetical protein